MNPSFDYAAICRNVSDRTLRNIFWDVMVSIFYGDKSVPHRNYENVIDVPDADRILEDSKVVDEFILAAFEDIVGPDQTLVIFCDDGTYIMKGKSKSLRLQKRTYCVYKHRNCFKICSLTDYTGKVAVYTAPCASNSPDNGDGNLLIDQLLLEMDLKCHPCFGQLLRPENKKFVVLFFVDRGYMKVSNRYPISLNDYYYNPGIQNPMH